MTSPRPAPEPLHYTYTLTFDDGTKLAFDVRLDPETLELLQDRADGLPAWTRLDVHKCPNCPLDAATHPHCPAAASVAHVVEGLAQHVSHEPVEASVETPNRRYSRRVPLQTATSSLIGLHMPTSGCPVLAPLRPLVETHLPFPTREETLHRMVTLYLLTQYVRRQRGEAADWELSGLQQLLDAIHKVNVYFCRRLNEATSQDASVNAVVILSALGDFPQQTLSARYFEHLARILKLVEPANNEGA